MISLSTAFKAQIFTYIPLLSLYVGTFVSGDKGWMNLWGAIKPDMAAAVYPDLDPVSDTQTHMAGLLVSLVVGNLILVGQAQYFKPHDVGFRAAVQTACFYFHALQPIALLLMRRASLADLGTLQFLTIHTAFGTMFYLAKE